MSTTSPASNYILTPAGTPSLPSAGPLPSSPSPSSSAELASPPSSYTYLPTMMSVVYPQYIPAAAAGQPQQVYYIAQPAGQWATVGVSQTGTPGYYYTAQPQQPQHPPVQQNVVPAMYAMGQRPRTASMAARPVSTIQPPMHQPILQQSVPQMVKTQPLPITYPSPQGSIAQIRPPLRRRSSVSFSDDAISVESEPFAPASPVFSDATSSSSSSSGSSHLNLSRSAMNHYTAPHRDRPPPQSILRSSSYDVPPPRSSVMLANPTGPIYAQQTGPAGPVMTAAPQVVGPRSLGPSARPISFHEDQVPVYSSYELYQQGPTSRSHPPVTRPVLTRRASSRSLSGSYGAGLSMGGGPGIMGFGSMDDFDAKKKWWKVGR